MISGMSNQVTQIGAGVSAREETKGFSLDLEKASTAPTQPYMASAPNRWDRREMERYCFNAFNRLVSDVNELFDLLANQDPSLETKLDDLDLRINMLINFCRDTLPQSALNDLRGMRELVDSIRGALGFETQESGSFTLPRPDWDAAGRFLNGIWEMLQKFAPFFGGGLGNRREFGAP